MEQENLYENKILNAGELAEEGATILAERFHLSEEARNVLAEALAGMFLIGVQHRSE